MPLAVNTAGATVQRVIHNSLHSLNWLIRGIKSLTHYWTYLQFVSNVTQSRDGPFGTSEKEPETTFCYPKTNHK